VRSGRDREGPSTASQKTNEGCRYDGEEGQHGQQRQLVAGPVDARTFGGPEAAECGQKQAHDELNRVLGDARERSARECPGGNDDNERSPGAGGDKREMTLGASEGDHDEDDLEALEEDSLECDCERVPIETRLRLLTSRGGVLPGTVERLVLVVQVLEPARPEDRLAQPLQSECEQECADDEAQPADRDVTQSWTERGDQNREHGAGGRNTDQSRAPTANDTDTEYDRQRLDHLHRGGKEGAGNDQERARTQALNLAFPVGPPGGEPKSAIFRPLLETRLSRPPWPPSRYGRTLRQLNKAVRAKKLMLSLAFVMVVVIQPGAGAASVEVCTVKTSGGTASERAAVRRIICRMPGSLIQAVQILQQPPDAPPETLWLAITVPRATNLSSISLFRDTRGKWEANLAAGAIRDDFDRLGLGHVVAYEELPPGAEPSSDYLFGIARPKWEVRRWTDGAPSRNLGKRAGSWQVLQAKLRALTRRYRVRTVLTRYEPLGKAPLVSIFTPRAAGFLAAGGFDAYERVLHVRQARYDGVLLQLATPIGARLVVFTTYRARQGQGCSRYGQMAGASRFCHSD
jgi:hypothetical protein